MVALRVKRARFRGQQIAVLAVADCWYRSGGSVADTRMTPRGWTQRATLLACAALLVLGPVGGKKAKRRKAGFLETPEKREKYVDYLFERYDQNDDQGLDEEEVDVTNDEEPLFRIHQKYDDTLETVR